MLNDTESYFNNGIKQAVKAGDIDKALKLMNEAEKLGSTTARKTFISSVKGRGNTRRCRCWLDDWCALAHLFIRGPALRRSTPTDERCLPAA